MAITENQPKAPEKSAAAPKSSGNPDSVSEQLKSVHEARTQGEDGLDARLDNRRGDQRPKSFDAKPQSVSGPDVAGQSEHTRKFLAEKAKG